MLGLNFLDRHLYAKPAGVSLLIHSALLALFVILGGFASSVAQQAPIVAVEVDIVPAVVVDARKPVPVMAEPLPPAGPPEKPVPKPVPAEVSTPVRSELLPEAMPAEAGETSVAVPVSQGLGTVVAAIDGRKGSQSHEPAGGGKRTAASCYYSPKPVYPQTARKAGWEGAVVVRVLIDTEGSVTAAVREGSGYDVLDEAALRTVKKWRYSPATQDGSPVASFRDVRVRFRLADEE